MTLLNRRELLTFAAGLGGLFLTGLRPTIASAAEAEAYPEAEALRIGWPRLAGPFETFEAVPVSTPLVEELSRAVRLWESACADLGRAKGDRKPSAESSNSPPRRLPNTARTQEVGPARSWPMDWSSVPHGGRAALGSRSRSTKFVSTPRPSWSPSTRNPARRNGSPSNRAASSRGAASGKGFRSLPLCIAA